MQQLPHILADLQRAPTHSTRRRDGDADRAGAKEHQQQLEAIEAGTMGGDQRCFAVVREYARICGNNRISPWPMSSKRCAVYLIFQVNNIKRVTDCAGARTADRQDTGQLRPKPAKGRASDYSANQDDP